MLQSIMCRGHGESLKPERENMEDKLKSIEKACNIIHTAMWFWQVGRRMLKENGVETMDLLHGGNVPNWDRMTTNINVTAGFDELAATTGSTVYKTKILDTEYDCFNELIRYNDVVFSHSIMKKKGE